jgi:hypothetical protein
MKKPTRKLHLNRETLRNLANEHLREVAGGHTGQPTCNESQVVACTAFCTGRSDCICPSDACTTTTDSQTC